MVKMGNKSISQIAGIGDICIQTSMGCTLTLKDVRHIPDLRLNLISVHMLDNDVYNHLSIMAIGTSPREHWWWHEADYVVRCTRQK